MQNDLLQGTLKLSKVNDKETILKAAREKKKIGNLQRNSY